MKRWIVTDLELAYICKKKQKMGFLVLVKGFCILVCFFTFCFVSANSQNGERNGATVEGFVFIDGNSAIGRIDSDFICATLDWWPPEKCDYGTCSWDHASLLNLDLNNKILLSAVKAFSPLKIRLGGTLQDKVIYEDHKQPCIPFSKSTSELFGFTKGCLPLSRWDELNTFFKRTGALVIFGLNALTGRTIRSDGSAVGTWDSTNAESLMRYTVGKGYSMYGWELGNELSGNGVGVRVSADQYASDTIALQNLVQKVYSNQQPKPLTIAPGGFFDVKWFKEFMAKTSKSVDVVTHHIYNLGPGVDEHLVDKILDPSNLDREANTFSELQSTLRSSTTSATAWVGESGGAYNSGRNLVTNAFVFSFWYLDQLGMASTFDTKTYCRQSLIGGNYGLLNATTFVPNPDYYSALLWNRLMGRNVLSTSFSGTKKIRAYAHCAKNSQGITLLLINLDNATTVQAKVAFHNGKNIILLPGENEIGEMEREEYHLTAKDGDLHSQIMLLNGKILGLNSYGDIPPLEAVTVNSSDPITVAPFSIVFAQIPDVGLPACK
ncbi:heparanase-like protein 3 isoform X2 [Rhododendron vialii]|uniref:heparanase-like protein 3 isoform X2 n=1 Tax=Rhododendron vialii TaxID=182163 RepID=UPI00265FCAAE|nr:heparanase-like protein 3 isoform X2 [Rhododendron vialii]